MTIKVTCASILDTIEIAALGEAYWNEVKDSPLRVSSTFDKDVFNNKFCTLILDNSHVFLIAKEIETGRIVGFLWISAITPLWSDEFYMAEQYFYVLPDFRQSSAPAKLIDTAVKISRLAGCSFLQVGNLTANEKLEKTYLKRFTKLGSFFCIKLGD